MKASILHLVPVACILFAASSVRADEWTASTPPTDDAAATQASAAPEAEVAPAADAGKPRCPMCSPAKKKWRAGLMDLLEGGPARIGNDMFNLSFHTRIQAWGGWVGKDALLSQGDRLQESGFRLRRARFGVDGQLFKTVSYKLELDVFDQEKTGGPLYEAYIDWTPSHWFGFAIGMQKFPFVRTEMNSSSNVAHLDRAIGVNAMAPGSSMGVTVHTEPWKDHLTITLGVFNGLQRRASFFQGYEGVGISLGNKFERMSYVGRVDLEPLGRIGAGEVDLKAEKSFRLALGGGGFYSNGKTTEMYGASGYVQMKAWGFHFLGEAIWDHARPQAKPTTTNTVASEVDRVVAHATVGHMILREMLGISARVEYINDNMDIDDDGDQIVIAATLAHYAFGHHLKTLVEYQKRLELHGASQANDAVIVGVQLGF